MAKPLLIVVTGRPGSGKTTLAHQLAREICCPLLSRDELKEGYCVSQAAAHSELPADTNQTLYHTFFAIVDRFVDERISVVIEAAFQHKLWIPKLEGLIPKADVRLVICSVDPKVARTRMVERGLANPRRERFHRDFAVDAARRGFDLPVGDYDPPRLEVPTLNVGTANGYAPALSEIVDFASRGRFAPGNAETSAQTVTVSRLNGELASMCADQFMQQCGYARREGYFHSQLKRQEDGELLMWVAHEEGEYRGHVRLLRESAYPPFRAAGIPEISDLCVATRSRKRGIGTRLIRVCEASSGTSWIGIGVALYPDYNDAQRLYSKLGYTLDGNGVHYRGKPVAFGERPPFDDNLVMYFTRQLHSKHQCG